MRSLGSLWEPLKMKTKFNHNHTIHQGNLEIAGLIFGSRRLRKNMIHPLIVKITLITVITKRPKNPMRRFSKITRTLPIGTH